MILTLTLFDSLSCYPFPMFFTSYSVCAYRVRWPCLLTRFPWVTPIFRFWRWMIYYRSCHCLKLNFIYIWTNSDLLLMRTFSLCCEVPLCGKQNGPAVNRTRSCSVQVSCFTIRLRALNLCALSFLNQLHFGFCPFYKFCLSNVSRETLSSQTMLQTLTIIFNS